MANNPGSIESFATNMPSASDSEITQAYTEALTEYRHHRAQSLGVEVWELHNLQSTQLDESFGEDTISRTLS